MRVFHTQDGAIVAFGLDQEEMALPFISISADELPRDFAVTFALGKYRVEDGKLLAVEGFHPPAPEAEQPPQRGAGAPREHRPTREPGSSTGSAEPRPRTRSRRRSKDG